MLDWYGECTITSLQRKGRWKALLFRLRVMRRRSPMSQLFPPNKLSKVLHDSSFDHPSRDQYKPSHPIWKGYLHPRYFHRLHNSLSFAMPVEVNCRMLARVPIFECVYRLIRGTSATTCHKSPNSGYFAYIQIFYTQDSNSAASSFFPLTNYSLTHNDRRIRRT